jgi:FG-GAP-like repeat
MRMSRIAWCLVAGSVVVLAGQAGCGSGSHSAFGPGADASGDDGSSGSGSGGGSFEQDSGTVCTTAADCDGGVCAGGVCCSSAANVCGSSCCSGSDVCLLGRCVTPGAPCQTSDQCAMGQYCEPGIGSGDAGMPPSDSGCTSVVVDGRCLPIPPTCPGDAGATGDGGTCLEQCEYHPSGTGMLNAKVLWQWGPTAKSNPSDTDVWSTPTVGRMYDTNCDGKIDSLDSPVIVFVAGDVGGTCCGCNSASVSTCENAMLRMINGTTGEEIWTLTQASASSVGFIGSTPAIGDVDGDGVMDIAVMTGEGYIVLVDHTGKVEATSNQPYPHVTGLAAGQGTGWGGGIAIGDMDNDGHPEITFGDTIWTTTGSTITLAFTGGDGTGGGAAEETSALSDMDGDGMLDLLAGNTCYTFKSGTGSTLWNVSLPDGFPGVADFNGDGKPEAVLVSSGQVWILDGATGAISTDWTNNPITLPGNGSGGAPTVADFDGDGSPEIGVAQMNKYTVVKPDNKAGTLSVLWDMDNHDFSSSVTGSTVFDFEGDGIPEVVYADECWLWVFDGPTGNVRLAYSHSSFTGTEAAMLADINGDGHAELLIPSNGIDVSSTGWDCEAYQVNTTGAIAMNGQYWNPGPQPKLWYRGLVALGDSADSWVGTRTLWTEHTYHVTNVCDDTDNACAAPNVYGSIPSPETENWTLPWLNDFRQNVQDHGIFNAPDVLVSLTVNCGSPSTATVQIGNIGQAGLPTGVEADVYTSPGNTKVGSVTTTYPLLPGQTQTLTLSLASGTGSYYAQIYNNPMMPTFHPCNTDHEKSPTVSAACAQ